MYDHVQAVEVLLSKGAHVNARGQEEQTPLIAAADRGDPKVVELLLSAGADVNLQNKFGETALSRAISRRRRDVVKSLERYAIDH
jgi:ankyrin repeat protein